LNYSGGSYQYLKDDDGLIRVTEYHSASGNVSAEKIQQGQNGTPITIREHEYISHSQEEATVHVPSKSIEYPDENDANRKIETSHAYTFHAGTVQVEEVTTTLPAIPTEQNGSGIAAQRVERFDIRGNLTWSKDERGFITRNI